MGNHERIGLGDTPKDILVKMSEGNPGALSTLMQLMLKNEAIDPDSALAHVSAILFLDTLGIYGSNIYLLYNDICKRDFTSMVGVLRAVQLGILQRHILMMAINGEGASIDVSGLLEEVKKRLPRFGVISDPDKTSISNEPMAETYKKVWDGL